MSQMNSISVYLIKDEYKSFKSIVVSGANGPYEIEGGALYYKTTDRDNDLPSWVTGFFGDKISDKQRKSLKIKTVSAVYLTKVSVLEGKDVTFALAFGFGRFLIKSECIVRDFGLETSRHAVEVEQIKKMSTLSFDKVIKSKTLESLSEIKESEFFLDNDKDVLKSVTGRVRDITGAGIISKKIIGGKDPVSITAMVDINNLKDCLIQLYTQYLDKGEEGIRYTSLITKVQAHSTLSVVDTLLMDAIKKKKNCLWLSLPLGDEDQNTTSKVYKEYIVGTNRSDKLTLDLLSGLDSIEKIKAAALRAIPLESEKPDYLDRLYNCLYAELEDSDSCFLLMDGDVYSVQRSYKAEVDEFYAKEEVVSLPNLIKWDGTQSEGSYNSDYIKLGDGSILVMDEKLVYPEGHSKFELCDLLTTDGNLIHVKIYAGKSEPLGHLFNQGLISAHCIADKSILATINEKISKVKEEELPENKNDFRLNSTCPLTITFLILCKFEGSVDSNGKPVIPFFAKAVFMDVKKSIRSLNCDFNVRLSCMGGNRDRAKKKIKS